MSSDTSKQLQLGELEETTRQRILIAASSMNCTLLRNNSGAMKTPHGGWIRFGHGNISEKLNEVFKSSDDLGITVIEITPEMVGQKLGVFTAVEMKRADWKPNPKDPREIAQKNYHDWVRANYGYAGFANSVDMLRHILKK